MKVSAMTAKATFALALLCMSSAGGALAATPAPLQLQPASEQQGATAVVVFQDATAHFQSGVTTVSFGSGIAAGQLAVSGPTLMAVPIQISTTAPSGVHQVTVTTGSEVLSGAFTVTTGQATVTSIYPNSSAPATAKGTTVAVTVHGNFTHWTSGKTVASFGPGISVGGAPEGQPGPVTVSAPGTLVAQLAIDSAAAPGARNVVVTTASEVETVPDGFTVMTCSGTAASVVSVDPVNNATAPLNTAIRITFSAPLDRTTVNASNFQLQAYSTSSWLQPPTPLVSLDASGLVLTITPTAVLPAFVEIYATWTYPTIKDSCGNSVLPAQVQFMTSGTIESAPFQLVQTGFASGSTNLPLNTQISLRFNQPLDPATAPSGIVVSASNVPVTGQFTFSPDGTVATFAPASNLAANTRYLVSYTTALQNQAGAPLANPGTLSFTTGTGTSSPNPYPVAFPPEQASDVATNVIPTITFQQPIDLTSVSADGIVLIGPSGNRVPGTAAISKDLMTYSFTPASLLLPNSSYSWTASANLASITGLSAQGLGGYFTTGPSTVSPPHETAVSPVNQSTGVPENTEVAVQFDQPIDPGSVDANSITVTSAKGVFVTPGSVMLGADGRSVIWSLPSGITLSANTTYSVQASGVSGEGSGTSQPFSSSFTTGSTVSGPVCCELQLLSITPANGATGVASNSPVKLTFNKTLDPTSLTGASVTASADNTAIPGSWTANGPVAAFAPSVPYPPASTISVSLNGVRDYTGSVTNVQSTFVTADFTDKQSFQITAVTPTNGQTGVPVATYPTVTFSSPVNVASLSIPGAVQFFEGDSELGFPGVYSVSQNGKTVTLQPQQFSASTITVLMNSSVQDLYGNSLQPYRWSYTTGTRAAPSGPAVERTLPTGLVPVPANSPIEFFLAAPGVDPSTVSNGVSVTVNGVVFEGTASLAQNGQLIVWQPAEPYPAGANVSFFLNSVTDLNGNPVSGSGSFTVIGTVLAAPPQVASFNPYYNQTVAPNALIEIELSEPVLATSVNSSDVQVLNANNSPVSGTLTITGQNGTVIQFVPSAALGAGSYQLLLNQGTQKVTNTAGLPAPAFSSAFAVSGFADHAVPAVILTVPPAGATVGTNAVLTIQLSKAIDAVTVNSSTVQLLQGSVSIPLGFSFDTTRQSLIITPQQALAPDTSYTISLTGVYDSDSRVLPNWTSTFSTGSGPDLTGPMLVDNVLQGGTLALNEAIVLPFNKPIAPGTVNGNNIQVEERYSTTPVPGTWSLSPDGETITFVPAQPWAPDSAYTVTMSGSVTDVTGNPATLGGGIFQFFTDITGVAAPLQVQSVNPPSSATNVPLNALIQVGLNNPIAVIPPGSVTLTQGGHQVAITVSLSYTGQVINVTPSQLLLPQTTYTLTVSGLSDPAGNKLKAPFATQFTTGVTGDSVSGAITAVNPGSGATGISISDPITVYLNTPIDPTTFNPFILGLVDDLGSPVVGTTTISADHKSVAFQPAQKLIAGVQYTASFCTNTAVSTCVDENGNTISGYSWSFTTGGSTQSRPSVKLVSPPNGSSNVPENAQILVQFSAPINAGAVSSANLTVTDKSGHVVPGTISARADGISLLFTPSTALAAGTTYTVSISGIYDQNGNLSTPFTSSFTTAATIQTPGPGSFSVISVVPAAGSTLATNKTPITIHFSNPVDPVTVNSGVSVSTAAGQGIAGSWAVNGSSITFTPLTPYPATTKIVVSIAPVQPSLPLPISDYAGNTLQAPYSFDLTSAASTDDTMPRVISVTPANGNTSIGQNTPVVLVFSKSIDQSTLDNIALFAKGVAIPSTASISSDNRTVTLTAGLLPANTNITVVATPGVKDLSGNALIDFQSTFTTGNPMPPQGSAPQLVSARPASGTTGVPANTPIYLFISGGPLSLSTVQESVHVFQNGEAVAGTTQLIDGQIIQFIASSPYSANATVQVFLDESILDGTLQSSEGSPLEDVIWEGSFVITPDAAAAVSLVATDVLAKTPLPANGVLDYEYNQALDPSSIGADTVQLTNNCTGAAEAGTASVTGAKNNVLRFVPDAPLTAGCSYKVAIGSANAPVRTAAGQNITAQSNTFQASAAASVATAITAVSPPNGFKNVGVNAAVYVSFSAPINPASLTSSSIQLSDSSGTLAGSSLNIASGDQLVTVTPQAPLPANATMTLTISGITDEQGNVIPSVTEHFTTASGPDFTYPVLLSVSPSASPIPLNTRTITLTFSKPMDPATLMPPGFELYSNSALPATVHMNSSMTVFGFTLASPLSVGEFINFQQNGPVLDLAGNSLGSFFPTLTVGSTVDSSPLQVIGVNPPANLQNVPQNVVMQAQFSAEVSPSSLGGIQLLQGGMAVPAVATWLGDASVAIVPQQVLQPNLPYTISISGVKDALGNALTGPTTSNFSTVPALLEGAPAGTVKVPASTSNVSPNTTIQVTFTHPMNPLSLTPQATGPVLLFNNSTPVPVAFSLSPDATTGTWTPVSPLEAGTYSFYVASGTDIAGNGMLQVYTNFTVQ